MIICLIAEISNFTLGNWQKQKLRIQQILIGSSFTKKILANSDGTTMSQLVVFLILNK